MLRKFFEEIFEFLKLCQKQIKLFNNFKEKFSNELKNTRTNLWIN